MGTEFQFNEDEKVLERMVVVTMLKATELDT
jgi:hypothetical protein